MKKYRHLKNNFFGLIFLGGVVYFIYIYATAEDRVSNMCHQINSGMPISELHTFATDHGLSPLPNNESGVNYMVESKTFGRYGCKIMLNAGIVINAEYSFAN